jgi:cytochrome subunit of sulfide dehydrogenase
MERRSRRRFVPTAGAPRACRVQAAAFALLALGLAPASADAQQASPAGAESCTGCHAPAARGTTIPALDGRPATELATMLQEFRAGRRHATVMDRIAKGFSSAELEAIAAWFAGSQR